MSSPRDFLESIEQGVTQNWERACKLKGIAMEMISTQQLQGLSAVHSQGGADVLALSPDECGSYGKMLTELGRAAEECRVSCRKLSLKTQQDVEAAVTTGLSQDASQVAQELGAAWCAAVEAAQVTKDMVAWMDQKSISSVLLLEKTEEEVAEMDSLEMENLYEKIRSGRHRAHAESCRGWAETLLRTSRLPMEHAALQERRRGALDLGSYAVALMQQRQKAGEICQALQERQVDLAAKMQERMLTTCLAFLLCVRFLVSTAPLLVQDVQQSRIAPSWEECAMRRSRADEVEELEREKLQEACRAFQTAWQSYMDAFVEREALLVVEAVGL